MTASDTDRLLAAAMANHQGGRLPQAEALYRQALAANPKQVVALRYLGILLHQAGRSPDAAELLGQAIALDERDADTHFNIGAVLQTLDRLDEAASHYARVIVLNSSSPEAHYELGNVLARQDNDTDAAMHYQRALALRPDYVEALTNLGSVLLKQGNPTEAVARWRVALALQPQHPVALMNMGLVLKQQGQLQDAITQFRSALAAQPGYADAHYNLGATLQGLGQWDEARAAYRRALANKPDAEALSSLVALLLAEGNIDEALRISRRAVAASESQETRSVLATCLCSPLLQPGLGDLRDVLVRALTEPWARPSLLAYPATQFLSLNRAVRDGMIHADQAWPRVPAAAELAGVAGIATFAEEPLLRALLESCHVSTLPLERFATALRLALLTAAQSGDPVSEPVLRLYASVARQCFINNHVFAQPDPETTQARALRDTVVAALKSGEAVTPLSLLAVAAYFPLAPLPGIEALLERPWPDSVSAVLAQQVRAPLEEQQLRSAMPVLTSIDAGVSAAVREQYEENPYPQWVKAPKAGKPQTVNAFIRQKFPLAPFVEFGKTDGVEVLVAGCGTGQHSIDAAQRFRGTQVLAIDLSLASLAYAQRQTRTLGPDAIQYAQADIVNLASLGRSFDVIESVGVLHHLADPLAGWSALVSMLRPGGIMMVGLYSELARKDLAAARGFIAERGYGSTAEDIRRFRQDYLAAATGAARDTVVAMLDFFSLNECRDLLFHRQEHWLTLPEIAAFLAANNLQFLGFEIDLRHRRNYARQFPGDLAMTDLAQWHRHEVDNPSSFIQMYQFWVQKKPA